MSIVRTSRGAILALALIGLPACGVDSSGTGLPSTTSEATTVPTVPKTAVPPATTLPGDATELGPAAGDVLAVVGVAHDDVLNLRDIPGGSIVAELDPLESDVVATGQARLLPGSIWYEVKAAGAEGWVNSSYVAFRGDADDASSEIVTALGQIPSAKTMEALGLVVAESLASDDPPSMITMTVAPTVGDFGEVTYDVIGLGDDSVYGMRLHVFGQPEGDVFSLYSVERTWLCGRGVTEDGLCI